MKVPLQSGFVLHARSKSNKRTAQDAWFFDHCLHERQSAQQILTGVIFNVECSCGEYWCIGAKMSRGFEHPLCTPSPECCRTILGLRSRYFTLARMFSQVRYLDVALAMILLSAGAWQSSLQMEIRH